MGFMGFFKNFGKVKANDIGKNIMEKVAAWDPDGASAAEIESMSERLDKITRDVAEARAAYTKEQREADEAQSLYNKRLQAAEILQKDMESSTDEAEKTEISTALNELVNELEEMAPDVTREKEEADEAKAFMEELEELAKIAADKLKTAKKSLDQAKRDMKRAKIREERANDRADQTAKLAGFKEDTDKLGSALDAMRREADKANTKAEALNMKTKLLAPTKAEKENSRIEAALKRASGGSAESSSITDRLAALKK
jgi:chromosome segregation ATPase